MTVNSICTTRRAKVVIPILWIISVCICFYSGNFFCWTPELPPIHIWAPLVFLQSTLKWMTMTITVIDLKDCKNTFQSIPWRSLPIWGTYSYKHRIGGIEPARVGLSTDLFVSGRDWGIHGSLQMSLFKLCQDKYLGSCCCCHLLCTFDIATILSSCAQLCKDFSCVVSIVKTKCTSPGRN